MINCYKSLILILFTSMHQLNSQQQTIISNSSKSESSNSLKDPLTAMFYHAKETKKCGTNLQKFNVSLEPLWSNKFQLQIKNTLILTSLFNSYINDNPNLNESKKHKITDFETNFQSLCSFMLTQLNTAQNQNDQTKTARFKAVINLDQYITSIGYILFNIDTLPQCFSVQSNPGKTELKTILKNRSCSLLNYNNEKQTDSKPAVKDDDSFSAFKGFESIQQPDISLINCSNWYENMKKAYLLSSDFKADTDYISWMQMLLNNQKFTSSLWCGPFYECKEKKINERISDRNNDWVLKYSLPLLDTRKNIIGSVSVKLKLGQLDLNQCSNGDPIVSNSHKCKENSECLFSSNGKFSLGSYKCKCTNGFMNNGSALIYDGNELEHQYWQMKNNKNKSYADNFDCMPCSGQKCCSAEYITNTYYSKIDNNIIKDYENRMDLFWQCRNYNFTVRILIISVQVISIIFVLWLAIFIFYKRQNKVIKHSMWILCEMMLFGAFLLYFTLIIQYFEPSTITCIAIPWFRELGFTIVYGILNLRLYKILIEFQSRKAHCVQLKDKDILRILSFIIVCVFGYLTAWTLVDLDYASEGYSVVTNTSLKGFVQYPICKVKWWDYFIEIGEFLFICVGFYLLYCTRTAPSEFNERKFISLVFCFEASVSTLLHIIKHSINNSIHPDTILILFFIRCHATVTVMLLLIFITKVCFLFKQNSDEICLGPRISKIDVNDITAMDPLKFPNHKGKSNGNYDIEEFNLMEPSEIRSELKRLYTEIHVFKTKSLKYENPHIQNPTKRKMKKIRKFSNAFMKQNTKETESVVARTPEESVCSNDFNYSLAQPQN